MIKIDETPRPQLVDLERRLELMCQQLGSHSPTEMGVPSGVATDGACDLPDLVTLAAKARAIYVGRRARDSLFGLPTIFAEPAWDIMLDLFAAKGEGQSVSVSNSVEAAAVAPTSALRWIQTLIDYGLLQRVPDPIDRRRCFLQLSERGFDLVSRAVAVA